MPLSVYVTCPNGSGYLHKLVHFAIVRILADGRFKIRHDCPTHSPYVNNLHRCMHDFLDNGEDYWLSMDDDNPPTRNPLDLIDIMDRGSLDFMGLPTPVWHSAVTGDRPWYYNAMRRVGEDGWKPITDCGEPISTEHPTEVDAVGSGCFIVSRKMAHRMIQAYPEGGPFARVWKNGLVEEGGDFSFCRRAKEQGFRIWTHFGYPCEHLNRLPIGEVVRAFGEMSS